MAEELSPEEQEELELLIRKLKGPHGFTEGSIELLDDKGFELPEYRRMAHAMDQPDMSFEERRGQRDWLDIMLDRGDAIEMTMGRYNRYVTDFTDISSEQALVQGRMKFAVEYIIALADEVSGYPEYKLLVDRPFYNREQEMLRSIYEDFRTKDFAATKIIERKTNHDIVAANTWATIRAQQLGLKDDLMRRLIHFGRTSADVNTNVWGELYTKATGQYLNSLSRLVDVLGTRAHQYADMTCVAETHGQDAQITTLGQIYGNLAEQISQHAKPFLGTEPIRFDGKMAGAIGTDVDMKSAFPDIDFTDMYKHLVEDMFGLTYVEMGNDQDATHAQMSIVLDTIVNVGNVVKKSATDKWIYCSRGMFDKKTKKGESGSSIMPQKTNPFLAEGAEALVDIFSAAMNPIKGNIVAYREQGDLRRSITKREGYHYIMLSIIANERLRSEINNYNPNVVSLEREVYAAGPKIISSAINMYLRSQGIPDAYDRVKDIVMRPYVGPSEIELYIEELVEEGEISPEAGKHVNSMLQSVMDVNGKMYKLQDAETKVETQDIIYQLIEANKNPDRLAITGHAVDYARSNGDRAIETSQLLKAHYENMI